MEAPSRVNALVALCGIARFNQFAAGTANLGHQLGLAPSDVASVDDLLRSASHLGLKSRLSRSKTDRLTLTSLPAVTSRRKEAGQERSVILSQRAHSLGLPQARKQAYGVAEPDAQLGFLLGVFRASIEVEIVKNLDELLAQTEPANKRSPEGTFDEPCTL